MFEEVLEKIENDSYKEIAKELIQTIPEYFYEVPASSTGKYHPDYAVTQGGLYKHTLALCRFLEYFFETEVFSLTSEEKDVLRIAGMMHDSRKSGEQSAFEKSKYTNFDHPIQAAAIVRSFSGKYNEEAIEAIASAIESHMGKWNTDKRSGETLPIPKTKLQRLLHLADYLASRKPLEMKFEDDAPKPITIMPYGKYKGMELKEVPTDYFEWLLNNTDIRRDVELAILEEIEKRNKE